MWFRDARPSLLAVCVVLLALSPTVASGQEAESQSTEDLLASNFIDRVNVNVVNVDVFVTDKKGNRVEGLTQDDFELRVDRRPVAITNFYAIGKADALQTQDERVDLLDSKPEPTMTLDSISTASQLSSRGSREDQQLHMVIYVDNFNIHPRNRNRLFRHVRAMMGERIQPNDRIMVVTYDRGLKVEQDFTSDLKTVFDTLRDVEEMSGHADDGADARRDLLNAIYDKKERWEVAGWVNQYVETAYREVQDSTKALKRFIESMAGLPGRKAVLYVSDGLAMRAGEDIFYAMEEVFEDTNTSFEVSRRDLTRNFQEITQQANAYRVTFYTIEAAGLRAYTFIDVENATSRGGAQLDQIYFASLKDPLYFLANETGGQAIVGTNNFQPMLDRLADDFYSYYSLGFQLGGIQGRYHDIDVKVKGRKDLVIRHREGFRDKPPSRKVGDATLAALFYGYERNDIGLEIEVGQAVRQSSSNLYEVPLVVRIPMGRLAFLPQEEYHSARLRLYLAVKDEDGAMSPVEEVSVPIDISKANFELAQDHFYHFQHRLLARDGRLLLAIGMHDEIGSGTAVVSRGFSVGG